MLTYWSLRFALPGIGIDEVTTVPALELNTALWHRLPFLSTISALLASGGDNRNVRIRNISNLTDIYKPLIRKVGNISSEQASKHFHRTFTKLQFSTILDGSLMKYLMRYSIGQ